MKQKTTTTTTKEGGEERQAANKQTEENNKKQSKYSWKNEPPSKQNRTNENIGKKTAFKWTRMQYLKPTKQNKKNLLYIFCTPKQNTHTHTNLHQFTESFKNLVHI